MYRSDGELRVDFERILESKLPMTFSRSVGPNCGSPSSGNPTPAAKWSGPLKTFEWAEGGESSLLSSLKDEQRGSTREPNRDNERVYRVTAAVAAMGLPRNTMQN